MAKIQSFYISKVNEELKYASSKYSQIPFVKNPEDSDSDSDNDDESKDNDKDDNNFETENESEEELIIDYDVDKLASKYLD
ncbi:unnamed protein product [Rhizophagus irregularis]|nr:unnamed protein product [Rhizophagus irregularis]CAB5186795.1 unnamed protein product [Rhizophagus irregularis]